MSSETTALAYASLAPCSVGYVFNAHSRPVRGAASPRLRSLRF